MSDTEIRAVLVKPGDALLIGNVGQVAPEQAGRLVADLKRLGIKTFVFAADIDIDLIPQAGDA